MRGKRDRRGVLPYVTLSSLKLYPLILFMAFRPPLLLPAGCPLSWFSICSVVLFSVGWDIRGLTAIVTLMGFIHED